MLSITQSKRQCTIAGFNECHQDGETGCCDVSKTFTACPTGYFSCEKPEFVERGYAGACCPQGYTCLIAPSCASQVTQPPETSVSVELVTETSMIISTKPFTVTSTEVSTKTSISTASAETSSLPVDTLTTLVPPPVDTTTTEAGTTEVGSTTEAGSTTDIGTPIDTSAPIPGTSESTHLVTQTLEPSSLTRDTTQTSIFWKTTTEKSIPSASPIISKVYEIKLSIGTPQRTRLSKATVVGASIGSLAAFFVMGLTLLWWLKKWRGSRVPMESVEQQPVKDIQQPKAELPATAPMSELPGGPG